MLFRWFVGLPMDAQAWDHSVFLKNRNRLNEHALAQAFFREVVHLAERGGLLSEQHFSVNGTLLQAWPSHKSFKAKDGPPDDTGSGPRNALPDFKGDNRRNTTHASSSDPEACRYCKGNTGAQPSYQGHVLIERRHGLACHDFTNLFLEGFHDAKQDNRKKLGCRFVFFLCGILLFT